MGTDSAFHGDTQFLNGALAQGEGVFGCLNHVIQVHVGLVVVLQDIVGEGLGVFPGHGAAFVCQQAQHCPGTLGTHEVTAAAEFADTHV